MAMNEAADGTATTLFNYAVTSAPDPLQTSAGTAPSTGTITIAVTAPGGSQPAFCNQIAIMVPIGIDGDALSAQTPTTTVNTNKWSLTSSSVRTAAEVGMPGADSYATFTYVCNAPADFGIGYPLSFTLTATVNTMPGTTAVSIEETSGKTSDPSTFTAKDAEYPVEKAAFVFAINSFVAAAASTPTLPATEFANGVVDGIVFSWSGNGTNYAVYAGDQAEPVYSGQDTSFTLKAGPRVDTTYVLQAELTSDGAGGEGREATGSQFLSLPLTLTVSNPDLVPNSVTAAGAIGGATLAIAGTARVAGALTASAGAAVTGGLGTDTLNASGAATLGSMTTAGGAAVTGGMSADNLTVTNVLSAASANVTGSLRIAGTSNIINGAQAVAFNTTGVSWYNARTDGFLVAFAGWDAANVSAHNTTRMAAFSGIFGTWLYAQGGNQCAQIYGDVSWWMAGNLGAITLPVQAGTQFGVQQMNDPNNDDNAAACYCWFVPLGAATPFAETFEAADAPEAVAPPEVLYAKPGGQAGGGAAGGKDILAELRAALKGPDGEAFRAEFGDLVRSVSKPQPRRR